MRIVVNVRKSGLSFYSYSFTFSLLGIVLIKIIIPIKKKGCIMEKKFIFVTEF